MHGDYSRFRCLAQSSLNASSFQCPYTLTQNCCFMNLKDFAVFFFSYQKMNKKGLSGNCALYFGKGQLSMTLTIAKSVLGYG